MMQVLPVLDILNGIVVHGIAGRRNEYRPIVSRLTESHESIAVANTIRNEFGLSRLYIADLDGILTRRPNHSLYRQLIADGFGLLIDPGIREPDEARAIHESTTAAIIVGLETCRTPNDLALAAAATPNITFSLDLFQGVPRVATEEGKSPHPDPLPKRLGRGGRQLAPVPDGWSDRPEEILRQAAHSNVTSIIILDLSDVGMGTGGSTDSLCRFVRTEFPKIRLIAGGGVRGRDDLNRLSDLGVDEALVASALHDGRLRREDIST